MMCNRFGRTAHAKQVLERFLDIIITDVEALREWLATSIARLEIDNALDAAYHLRAIDFGVTSHEGVALERAKRFVAVMDALDLPRRHVIARTEAGAEFLRLAKEPIFGCALDVTSEKMLCYAFKVRAPADETAVLSSAMAEQTRNSFDGRKSKMLTVTIIEDSERMPLE